MKIKQVLIIIFIVLIAFYLGYNFKTGSFKSIIPTQKATEILQEEHHSPPLVVIEPGSAVEEASYIIFKDDEGFYYAKNGSTGAIDYKSTDASAVIQPILDLETNTRIYFKNGDYLLSSGLNILHNKSQHIIFQGETRRGVRLKLNAPNRIRSYSAVSGITLGSANWPRIYLRDITIQVGGNYTDLGGQGTPVLLSSTTVEIENVQLEAYCELATGASAFEFGAPAGPGAVVVWNYLYVTDAIANIHGPGDFSYVLKVMYEGLHWIGGGWGINSNITDRNDTLVLFYLRSGASQPVILEDIDGWAAPNKGAYRKGFISCGFLELRNFELMASPRLHPSVGRMFFPIGNRAFITIRYSHGQEGGHQLAAYNLTPITATTGTFMYQEGIIRLQNSSVAVGLNDAYSTSSYYDVWAAPNPRIRIVAENIGSETISVELNVKYLDGTTKSITKTFTSSEAYELSLDDIAALGFEYRRYVLEARAKTDQASTSATVRVEVLTT